MPNIATPTHCPYCALQCGMNLTPTQDGGVAVVERPDFPVNRGALCGKGRTAPAVLASGVRLTTPLVRSGGALVEASWPEALDRIAEGLARTRDGHGQERAGQPVEDRTDQDAQDDGQRADANRVPHDARHQEVPLDLLNDDRVPDH